MAELDALVVDIDPVQAHIEDSIASDGSELEISSDVMVDPPQSSSVVVVPKPKKKRKANSLDDDSSQNYFNIVKRGKNTGENEPPTASKSKH